MGKLLRGRDGERVAGKCHHPRGRGKILLRHMFLCRYVNPRVSLDGIDVFRVGHWGCFCRVQAHIPSLLLPFPAPVLYNFVKIVHVKRRREDCLRRPSDISRVSDDAYRRDAALLPSRISSRRSDKCDGRLRVVLQKRKERKRERERKGERGGEKRR